MNHRARASGRIPLFSLRYFHSSIPLIVFDHNRVEHDNNRSRPKGRNGFTHPGNAGGYQCQRGYFWRLADVADGYWRRHYGQRDRPGSPWVTVRVDGMTFLRPVAVGDVVCCYARCVKRGNTSVTINIEVWVKKVSSEPIGQRYKATEALFIYVAVDNQGKPRPLPAE
ncbi:hypothetical protein CKQ90_17790 [Klebsiella pneumoniae]|nr:hypothetical protein CKQ90_17790 [Klebsiella pneumoniae]